MTEINFFCHEKENDQLCFTLHDVFEMYNNSQHDEFVMSNMHTGSIDIHNNDANVTPPTYDVALISLKKVFINV